MLAENNSLSLLKAVPAAGLSQLQKVALFPQTPPASRGSASSSNPTSYKGQRSFAEAALLSQTTPALPPQTAPNVGMGEEQLESDTRFCESPAAPEWQDVLLQRSKRVRADVNTEEL